MAGISGHALNGQKEGNTMNVVYNMDCMEYMRTLPDKAFDLAVVDPPYGIGMDGGVIGGSVLAKNTAYTKKQWDTRPPSPEYFLELDRVSRNQIIWGGQSLYQPFAAERFPVLDCLG